MSLLSVVENPHDVDGYATRPTGEPVMTKVNVMSFTPVNRSEL